MPDLRGGARYATVEDAAPTGGPPSLAVLGGMIRGVVASRNLVVVKTDPGEASLLGIAIDRLSWPQVAGTVAGDDTLLVVIRERSPTSKVVRQIKALQG